MIRTLITIACLLTPACAATTWSAEPASPRPRARELHIEPGVFPPGPRNAITDVAGVRVGQVTLISGDNIRTGVTAILPHDGNLFQQKVPGAVFVGNAFGKLAGSTQVNELGTIETPIVLTNTLAVGVAVDAVVGHTLSQKGNEQIRSVNALVGETNDGGLNDVRSRPVTAEHVLKAITTATGGEVAEGCVGAGTGCEAFGFKGGIGTASRKLPEQFGGWTLGVLVQANFGGVLMIDGLPIGKQLQNHPFVEPAKKNAMTESKRRTADGSCMIVVATDAPLSPNDLRRLAARAVFGLARTGSSFSNGSGDFAIAFSTAPDLRVSHQATATEQRHILLASDALTPLFEAALESTEEAVYNALLRATTTKGSGRTVEAISIEKLREQLQSRSGK